MKRFFICICDFCRLIIAMLIALFIFVTIVYLFPNDRPNLLPEYFIETTKDLTTNQTRVVEQLYLSGKLTNPADLYGKIVEYYHFLVFLIFALLALVGGFVYLQIKQEASAKIDQAIKDGIKNANIEGKIHKKIEEIEIDKIITEQIDEEALAERISVEVTNTTMEQVQIGFYESFTSLRNEIADLRKALESAAGGIDEELSGMRSRLESIEDNLEGGA